MGDTLKISTFNVENLFRRAKVFNLEEWRDGDEILAKVDQLQKELKKNVYDGKKILNLYNELKDFIDINEVREKLFKRLKFNVVGVKAKGRNDWGGFVAFKADNFPEITRMNTAKVINSVSADIISLIEVENKPTLDIFNSQLIKKKYPYSMLIDAFDPRGIDVSLLSRLEMCDIRTHMFEKVGRSPIFSRDCLEVTIKLPGDDFLYFFVNHFKSQGYGSQEQNDAKRLRQAKRVLDIIKERNYDLTKDKVVVLGDFNAPPESKSLSPLMNLKELRDVLALKIAKPEDRWTYHYDTNQQLDFILVSEPLQKACKQAGVERRGIFDVAKYSNGEVIAWPEVQDNGITASASDHGAVWAEFDL
ncbi:MAG: endonuclease/exonuclease/phosphatase family protein [Dehalococcoidia bacterium]